MLNRAAQVMVLAGVIGGFAWLDAVGQTAVQGRERCVPTTCEALGATCGPVADGCGHALECGVCELPTRCGGDGSPGTCGTPPLGRDLVRASAD